MTEASWPFYGVETNETQFSKWARLFAYSGVSTGLAVTPGTGLQVVVGAGSGLVQGVYYENDANKTLAIGAAPATAGQTRKDALILRLDQSANTVTTVIKPGTANTGGGTLPALTQTDAVYEILLAVITVAQGTAAISAAMIDEARPSIGLRVHAYAAADRPVLTGVPVALGLDTTNDRLEMWDGAAWSALVSADALEGVVALENGGTGSNTAAGARGNLGVAAAVHGHTWGDISGKPTTFAPSDHNHDAGDITTGTLSAARGGTGTTSMKLLRQALDIYVQPSAPSHKAGRIWIPGTALA